MQILKKTFSLWIVLSVILGMIHIQTVEAAGKLPDGSTIAGVLLEGLTTEEAKQVLQEEIDKWLDSDSLLATNEQGSIEIPRKLFQFDVDASLIELEEKTKRHWSNFFMKQKNVTQELFVKIDEEAAQSVNWPDYVDIELTLEHALVQATNLADNNVALAYIDNAQLKQEEIATVTLQIPDISEATIDYLVNNLNGQTIDSSDLFSFLDRMILPNGMANSEEEMSFLASALYKLALQTNLAIIERHPQKSIASYTEAGLEVDVNRNENRDLKLHNPNNFSYTVHAMIKNDEIQLSFEAVPSDLNVNYSIENEVEVEPRTIYRYSNILQPGEEKVIQEGRSGLQLEVYRAIEAASGTDADKELIARDYYPPIPQVIEVAVDRVEETPEVDQSSTIEHITGGIDRDAIINQLDQTKQATISDCDEDSAECEASDVNLTTLLLACMLEKQTDTTEDNAEQDAESANTAEENPGLCEFLLFYLVLGMLDTDSNVQPEIGEQTNFLDELLLNSENQPELVNEEETSSDGQEEVK